VVLVLLLLFYVNNNKAKAYLKFIVLITKSNDKRNDKVKPLNPKDNGKLLNLNEADPTIPEKEGLLIGNPEFELNYARRIGFKILNYYTNSRFAPSDDIKTPVGKITEEVRDYWTSFKGLMAVPTFPEASLDKKASEILLHTLRILPCTDYVKLAIKNCDKDDIYIDLSYLSNFETQDKKPLGAKIYLKNVTFISNDDGTIEVTNLEIEKIQTDRYGMDHEITEKSYAVASRAVLLDLSWHQHLFLCHLYTSSLVASEIISNFEPESRWRRLFAPFFMDSRSLLFDEVAFLTNNPNGEVMRTTGMTYQGMIDFIHYCLGRYSLDKQHEEAKYLHKEYIDLLEEHMKNLVGDHDDLHINLKNYKTSLNSTQIMATFVYLVSVKHKIFGTSINNLLPYLNLKVDDDENVYRTGLIYTLSTAFGTFYNFKAMLQDDFAYLATTDEERLALCKFRVKIFELDAEQRRQDPNNPNQSYATELDTSCMR
jgi:hypothetical protein